MLENKIVAVSDLKLYSGARNVRRDEFPILINKLGVIWGKSDDSHGTPHLTLLLNLYSFANKLLIHNKYFIVIIDNESYDGGERLLLSLLNSANSFKVGLLPVMSEIYLAYLEKESPFTELEFQHIDIGFDLLPAIGELIDLLNIINSKFIFQQPPPEVLAYADFTIEFLIPKLATDKPFIDIIPQNKSKGEYIKNIILLQSTYKEEGTKLLYLWIRTKIEYKFRVKELNLSAEEAVHLVVGEYTLDLSMDTIMFLCANPLVDLDEIRSIASERRELLKKKD